MSQVNARRPRGKWLLACVALLISVVIAYLPAMRAPFELDDGKAIPGNPSIRTLNPISIPLHPPENTSVSGRPTVNLTLAINYAVNDWLGVDQRPDPLGPNKTVGYHVVNLLIHIACGLLIFGVIRRTLWRRGQPEKADYIAFAVMALWLLHPIQTEAVNYVVQRTESLVSLCYLATLYAWIRAWDASTRGRVNAWRAAAVAACLAGMGCKEVMLTAPIIVLLYDRAFRIFSWRDMTGDRSRAIGYGALVICSAIGMLAVAGNARSDTVGFHLGITWSRYLYSQCWAISRYLFLALWPARLTFDYGTRPVSGYAGIPGLVLLAMFLMASIFAWVRASRLAWFGFLGATFFLLLAPSSSFVPIVTEIAAERRIYLALAPVLVLVVLAADSALTRLTANASRLRQLSFGIVCLVLAAGTFIRSRTYASAELLWRDTVAKAPENPRAYDNLASVLMYSDPPRLDEARIQYEIATSLDSTYVKAWSGLASIAIDQGRLSDALAFLDHALQIQPGYADAVEMAGRTLLRLHRPDLAIPYLSQYATAFPSEQSLYSLGLSLMAAGQLDSAATCFRRVLSINPRRADAVQNLGGILVERGRGAEAVAVLERLDATEASPTTVGLLAVAYAESGQAVAASKAAAIATANGSATAPVLILAGRAMLLSGSNPEAIRYLSEALRLSPGNAEATEYLVRARRSAR